MPRQSTQIAPHLQTKPLGDIATILSPSVRTYDSSFRGHHSVRVIKPSMLNVLGIDYSEAGEVGLPEIPPHPIQSNDLLLTSTVCSLVGDLPAEIVYIASPMIVVVRPNVDLIDPTLLQGWFNLKYTQFLLANEYMRGFNVSDSLDRMKIKKMPIPILDRERQTKIGKVMKIHAELYALRTKSLQLFKELFQAIISQEMVKGIPCVGVKEAIEDEDYNI
jgi:hypothetical protein